MKNEISALQLTALAIKRAKLKRCFAYDTPYIRYVCERLLEQGTNVRIFDGIDKISSVLSMCESEKSSTCFFIPQKYLALMEETRRFKDRERKVFIVFCDEDGTSALEIIKALKLSVWVPAKPSDIYSMLIEAAVYSKENNEAAAVLVPCVMMFEYEMVSITQLSRMGYDYKTITDRLRTSYRSGATLIVTCGSATDKVLIMTEKVDDVRVISLRAMLFNRWKFPQKTIFVMPAFDYNTPDEQSIRSELERNLNPEQIKQLIPQRRKTEILREREYYYSDVAAMCGGCIFRIRQSEYLDSLGKGWVAVAQEIFCEKKMVPVSSGMNRSNVIICSSLHELEMYHDEHPETKAVFFTNGRTDAGDGIEIVNLDKKGGMRMGGEIKLIKTKCDACGRCLDYTGCPAISIRGFIVNLSLKSCSGCTLCTRYCKRKALC